METRIKRKKNKLNHEPEMKPRVEEDRLSSLPDEIIHHILSFIDTKFAVQTCVLSKKWKFMWSFIPHLNLESCKFRTLRKFSKFVNRVLSCRNNYTEVSTVDLDYRGHIRNKFVGKIVSYAMSHNVQKINIILEITAVDDQYPDCLFDSESLKHLSLSACYSYIYVPCSQSPWNFPALTTLNLKSLSLCCDNTKSLDLFSKCVNLKNLTLDDCRGQNLGVMQIFCPKLVNLTLRKWSISKLALLTPNLSSFYYEGDSEVSLSTDRLNCLNTVYLEMEMLEPVSVEVSKRDAHRLISMLQQLSNAKNLVLHSDIIRFLSAVPDVLEHQRSPFSKLECLKLVYHPMDESIKSDVVDQVILYLLNTSSSADVIIELPECSWLAIILFRGVQELREQLSFSFAAHGGRRALAFQRSIAQELCKVLEPVLSFDLLPKLDPDQRQAIEVLKEDLVVRCQNFGLPPPSWSK